MRKAEKALLRVGLMRELLTVADILEQKGICPDVGPLRTAAKQCKECGGDHWGYEVSNLIMRLEPDPGTFPVELRSIDGRVSVRAAGLCDQANSGADPMTMLEVSLSVEGILPSTGRRFVQYWHFDRHISDANSAEPAAAHPRYHFHFGGRQMRSLVETDGPGSLGFVLLMDGPRLAHAPMDGVLIIDFMLSNFAGEAWRELRDDAAYTRLMYAAQKRNWIPFISALKNHWHRQAGVPLWEGVDVWPSLCLGEGV